MEQTVKNILIKAGWANPSSATIKSLVGKMMQINVASLGDPLEVNISAAYLTTEGVATLEVWSIKERHRDVRILHIRPDSKIICVNHIIPNAPDKGMTLLGDGDTFAIAA